jgi:hypothetical protein
VANLAWNQTPSTFHIKMSKFSSTRRKRKTEHRSHRHRSSRCVQRKPTRRWPSGILLWRDRENPRWLWLWRSDCLIGNGILRHYTVQCSTPGPGSARSTVPPVGRGLRHLLRSLLRWCQCHELSCLVGIIDQLAS